MEAAGSAACFQRQFGTSSIFSTGPSTCIWLVFCYVWQSRNENHHWKRKVLCLSRNSRQRILQVSTNTQQ